MVGGGQQRLARGTTSTHGWGSSACRAAIQPQCTPWRRARPLSTCPRALRRSSSRPWLPVGSSSQRSQGWWSRACRGAGVAALRGGMTRSRGLPEPCCHPSPGQTGLLPTRAVPPADRRAASRRCWLLQWPALAKTCGHWHTSPSSLVRTCVARDAPAPGLPSGACAHSRGHRGTPPTPPPHPPLPTPHPTPQGVFDVAVTKPGTAPTAETTKPHVLNGP
eukprot:COSAG04_NODE_8635_length_947_cov_3.057783_1_plen_220_part_00